MVRRSNDRRRNPTPVGAHPERRAVAPARRAALRHATDGPDTDSPAGSAVVLPPVVNMFDEADAHSPVVSQATIGSTLGIIGKRRGWVLGETPDRYRGWLQERAVRSTGTAAMRPYPATERSIEVISLLAHVYREPDIASAAPLTVAPMLSRLELAGEPGEDWLRVRLPDGRHGHVHRGDARLDPDRAERASEPFEPAAVVGTALRFLGIPYLWGGTTAYGLDCSGLSQLSYRAHGYLLPRDADQQFADPHLTAVDRDRLRLGDLVFFAPDPDSITHVGIVTAATEFISATTYQAPMVRVDRLDDPYWSGMYRGARRLG